MTLEDLGNVGEFVSALAVVVSLVYLAIQIRQNTSAVRTSTYHEAIRDQVSGMDQLNADAELNQIWYEGMRDFDALPKEAQRRFATYLTSVLRRYENILYQTKLGRIDPDAWVGVREHMRYAFHQPGTVAWWKRAKNLFNPELVEFVEKHLMSGSSPEHAA